MNSKTDSIFATSQPSGPFRFDARVAEVFPDMIQRSVPGYATMIDTIGQLAARYAQADSTLYDLGCSLGAATLAMRRALNSSAETAPGQLKNCRIVAVDNSEAMLERAQMHIEAFRGDVPVELICGDITELEIRDASMVVLNFTLQFIAPEQRLALLERIYQGMKPGAVLLLSEKLHFDDQPTNQLLTDLHHDFKRANGYSELEISQKRQALENVLVPDTLKQHQQRLAEAGFDHSQLWFQCYNFSSLVAFKR